MSASSVSDDQLLAPALYVVSTPIGNLGDITVRAQEVLRSVSLIVAEDTRHSRTLLSHIGISTPMSAYHEHNEARESPRIVRRIAAGEAVALISDAGTPLLSDPGARLVAAAIDASVAVIPIPGASALLAALVASGLPAECFTFLGFLPRKGGEREVILRTIQRSPFTTVLYESPQRVGATLEDLVDAGCADRPAAIARELTKRFEEIRRGTVSSLHAGVEDGMRGEVVLVVAGAAEAAPSAAEARETVSRMRCEGASSRDIIDRLTAELGVPRNVAYKLAHSPPDSTPAD
ncbi:MAG: 16S rRNA (cytidine(1402)-2'-O)-methyltransferase [Gemmatimonadota bacterium]|nr:16S rRNA (cytidine(1402)-2'-O)-methyltransferase [Gemmatimonadota bacterium]